MRDDIHKSVPRPSKVQRWVRMAVNDADRLSDRSFSALEEAQKDACRREISPAFVRGVIRELTSPQELFGHLASVTSPRDVGGRGGPLETACLSETKRLLAMGMPPASALPSALNAVMRERVDADIRVTAAVLPPRDAKSPVVINAMRSDAQRLNYAALAQSICDGSVYEARPRGRALLDLDGDMRGIGGRP